MDRLIFFVLGILILGCGIWGLFLYPELGGGDILLLRVLWFFVGFGIFGAAGAALAAIMDP